MKGFQYTVLSALAVRYAAAHATFQQLWVDGVDKGSTCVRLPASNSPITNVASADIRCNVGGTKGVSGKCAVKPGSTVTVEMHQVRSGFDRRWALWEAILTFLWLEYSNPVTESVPTRPSGELTTVL